MARYYDEVNERWVSNDDQEAEQMTGNINDLRSLGYMPELGLYAGFDRLSGAGGNSFANDMDYYTWLYGPGVTQESVNGETFYKTPNGADAYLPGRAPGTISSPDSNFTMIPTLALGSILGLGALNGAFGSLGGLGEMGFTDAASAGLAGDSMVAPMGADALTFGGGNLGSQFGTSALGLGDAATWGGGLGSEFGTAALGLGGAGGYTPSSFNFMDYIKNGVLPNGTTTTVPEFPDGSWGANLMSGAKSLFSGDNLIKNLGALGAAGLGAYGANQQADAYGNLASQYMNMGQPYRDKLLQSYQPGFDLASADPAFQGALDQAGQSAARATSARAGNPVDNPGAYAEMQKYITNSVALPQLNTYRSQLGSFGQLGTNQAGTAQMGQIQSQGGMYDALGYGLGQVTQPENPLKGLLDQFSKQTINNWRSY